MGIVEAVPVCSLSHFFVFALINLANTLMTSFLTRQQEFGVFQSVGMSGLQLFRMLSLERILRQRVKERQGIYVYERGVEAGTDLVSRCRRQ